MLMLEPASILTLESFRRLPPIVHKGNPGLENYAKMLRKTKRRDGDAAKLEARAKHAQKK